MATRIQPKTVHAFAHVRNVFHDGDAGKRLLRQRAAHHGMLAAEPSRSKYQRSRGSPAPSLPPSAKVR